MTELEKAKIRGDYYRQIYKLRLNNYSEDVYKRVKRSYKVVKWLVSKGYDRKKTIDRLSRDMGLTHKTYGILLRHKNRK